MEAEVEVEEQPEPDPKNPFHSRYIELCPAKFDFMSPSSAADLLIHEALHVAGLSENPPDPSAMTSGAIDLMVRGACGP